MIIHTPPPAPMSLPSIEASRTAGELAASLTSKLSPETFSVYQGRALSERDLFAVHFAIAIGPNSRECEFITMPSSRGTQGEASTQKQILCVIVGNDIPLRNYSAYSGVSAGPITPIQVVEEYEGIPFNEILLRANGGRITIASDAVTIGGIPGHETLPLGGAEYAELAMSAGRVFPDRQIVAEQGLVARLRDRSLRLVNLLS